MSDNLNKAESQSPMIDCSHPWKEIQTVHEFGEIYEQCRLCDHIITSRIINNEKIALLQYLIDTEAGEGLTFGGMTSDDPCIEVDYIKEILATLKGVNNE